MQTHGSLASDSITELSPLKMTTCAFILLEGRHVRALADNVLALETCSITFAGRATNFFCQSGGQHRRMPGWDPGPGADAQKHTVVLFH